MGIHIITNSQRQQFGDLTPFMEIHIKSKCNPFNGP